jgi:hypothetical protein
MCPAKGKSLKAPEARAKNDLASYYFALSLGLHYVHWIGKTSLAGAFKLHLIRT